MKKRLNPALIQLKDLPPEGREFQYSRDSGELNAVLADLIGSNPYFLRFHILPQGNSFHLKGHLSTVLDLACSSCAGDFKFVVEQDLHELIVIEPAMAKGDQMARVNHAHEWVEEGPDSIVMENDTFDVGEYAHEMVGLAEPIRPLCGSTRAQPDKCIGLGGERVERSWLTYGDDKAGSANIKVNPFEVLQKIKLKS